MQRLKQKTDTECGSGCRKSDALQDNSFEKDLAKACLKHGLAIFLRRAR